jgi:hypothetical protein
MRHIPIALIFLALVPIAAFSQAATDKTKPENKTPDQIPSIEQINEPVKLVHSSTKMIPDANHLVNLSFAVELNTVKPIRSYHVHFEQEFEDRKYGSTPIVVNSEMTIENSVASRKGVTFSCRRDAKAKVWVSIVEFEDGTIWKAELTKVAEAQSKSN